MKKFAILLLVILSGCAAVPPPRPAYTDLPTLEPGWGRLMVVAGKLDNSFSVDLRYETNTGPVFVSEIKVGLPAYREYIAVDLRPGVYEAYWLPTKRDEKFCKLKTPITIQAGETKYYAADQSVEAGMHFGLIGALVSDCLAKGLLNERALPENSRLVSYFKLQPGVTQNFPERATSSAAD
jgi:hypothetical protein